MADDLNMKRYKGPTVEEVFDRVDDLIEGRAQCIPLSELIDEWERDPVKAKYLAAARAQLAAERMRHLH